MDEISSCCQIVLERDEFPRNFKDDFLRIEKLVWLTVVVKVR
jgi:hypothetical protein